MTRKVRGTYTNQPLPPDEAQVPASTSSPPAAKAGPSTSRPAVPGLSPRKSNSSIVTVDSTLAELLRDRADLEEKLAREANAGHRSSRASTAAKQTPRRRASVPSTTAGDIAPTTTTTNVPSRGIGHAIKEIALRTDLVSALDPGQDRAFRARIQPDGGRQFDVDAARQHLQNALAAIDARSDIPEAAKRTLRSDIKTIERAIDSLTTDTKAARAWLLLLRPALSFLPLFLPLRSSPQQLKSMTVLIASYVKTNTLGAGLLLRPTTNSAVVWRHIKNRDFANDFQALALLANVFKSQRAIELAHSGEYNATMGVLSAATLVGLFYGDKIVDIANRAVHGSVRPSLEGITLSPETKDLIQQLGQVTDESRGALENERRVFKAEGNRLSDTGDWQVGQILQGMDHLNQDLNRLSGTQEAARPRNHDLAAKTTLAVGALLICAGCIPLFRNETIAVVDLSADAAFTTLHMGATALNPNASAQESLDAFKQWVGLSMVMLIVFGINEAKGDIINQGGKAFGVFAAGLAVANLLLPAVLGAGAAYAMGKLILAKAQRGDTESVAQDLEGLGGMAMDNLAAHLATEEPTSADMPQGRITESPNLEPQNSAENLTVLLQNTYRLEKKLDGSDAEPTAGDTDQTRRS
jgi:hypothetical protein